MSRDLRQGIERMATVSIREGGGEHPRDPAFGKAVQGNFSRPAMIRRQTVCTR